MTSLNPRLGSIGLGTMGLPMALRLADKFPLTVWNHTPTKYRLFDRTGAAPPALLNLEVIQS